MSDQMPLRTTETICAEINAVQSKMESAEKRVADLRDTRKALVLELRETHPDSWLAELKERCHIDRSQAFKIAAIADGRTTEEKEREKNAAAVRRHRAGRAASPLQAQSNGLDAGTSVEACQELIQKQADDVIAKLPGSWDADAGGMRAKPEAAEVADSPPREIAVRLSPKPPQTPEAVAADAMLVVEAFLKQHAVDLQLARAQLIRLLTVVHGADVAAIETANLDVDASAEAMKEKFAGTETEEPTKRRGRPLGSRNKPKATEGAVAGTASGGDGLKVHFPIV
jgi:hypothetical protein